MIYRSNLSAPDMEQNFTHLDCRVMGYSFGHSVLSDFTDRPADDPVFGIYKNCGFWTHDEAAILYTIARKRGGEWVDLGAHTGWTTIHIAAATRRWAYPIDPMHALESFRERFCENMGIDQSQYVGFDGTSRDYFKLKSKAGAFADGFCIDGDHEPGEPLHDAIGAFAHLRPNGVIILHDFSGGPVRDAALYLMGMGMKVTVYLTPHGVACCYFPGFVPPAHAPDPFIVSQDLPARWAEYDWRPHLAQQPTP